MGYLQLILEGSRVQGFEGSSEMLKNYKERFKDSRPALSRRGDYLKYRLSFIMMIVY